MTLTDTVILIKKSTPFFIIGVLSLLILVVSFQLANLIFTTTSTVSLDQPKNSAPASYDKLFGSLPPLTIKDAKSSSNYSYILDTFDGTTNIKEATSEGKVYYIPKQIKSLAFESKIYAMAQNIGIDPEMTPYSLEGDRAVFDDGKRRIEIDIDTLNFNYNYLITQEDAILDNVDVGLEEGVKSVATGFLQKINRYPEEIKNSKINLNYYKIDSVTREINFTDSPTGANAVEINFFQADFDNLPVVTSNYFGSQNYILFLKTERDYFPVKASVMQFSINNTQVGRYPLKTSNQAWENLQQGGGLVVSSQVESGEVKVSRIFLAYYNPSEYQEYFMPVFVFLGENRFVAYVSAVSTE